MPSLPNEHRDPKSIDQIISSGSRSNKDTTRVKSSLTSDLFQPSKKIVKAHLAHLALRFSEQQIGLTGQQGTTMKRCGEIFN